LLTSYKLLLATVSLNDIIYDMLVGRGEERRGGKVRGGRGRGEKMRGE
jgi:hypothetical protein